MKMMEVIEKQIGEHMFYIRPLPAFYSANLSGELANFLTPVFGSLATLADVAGDDGQFHLEDIDMEKIGPALSDAMSGVSGDKVETLMRKLLLNKQNISVSGPATDGDVKLLDTDLVNEVFCGEIQDMYLLCFEVIKFNFKGFFKKFGARFGNLTSVLRDMQKNTSDSENSMEPDFPTSN